MISPGYSSRFASSQPPNAIPKRSEQAEIDRQVAEFLAQGGVITRIEPMVQAPKPEIDFITGYSAEQRRAASQRAAAASRVSKRQRKLPGPIKNQVMEW